MILKNIPYTIYDNEKFVDLDDVIEAEKKIKLRKR